MRVFIIKITRAPRYTFFSFPGKNARCKFIVEITGRLAARRRQRVFRTAAQDVSRATGAPRPGAFRFRGGQRIMNH
jgi:hypothetical protein